MLRAHTSAHQADLIRMGLDNFLVIGDVYRLLQPFQNMINGPQRVNFLDYTIPSWDKLRWINRHKLALFLKVGGGSAAPFYKKSLILFNYSNVESPVRHRMLRGCANHPYVANLTSGE